MKKFAITLLAAAMTAGLIGCGDEDPAGEPNNGAAALCGDGEELTVDGTRACLYRNPLIEEGFDCPPEVALATRLDGALLCSEGQSLPEALIDVLEARGYAGPADGTPWNVTENNANNTNNVANNGTNNANNTNNGTDPDLEARIAEFDWFVAKCNGTDPLTEAENQAHFTDDHQFRAPMSSQGPFFEACQKNAPLTVDSLDSTDLPTFFGHLTNSDGASYRLDLGFRSDDTRINGFDFRILDEEDPDRAVGPVAAGEVMIRFGDTHLGRRAVGGTVELLDPSTGMPFSPPVTGTTNNYGTVRLTVPNPANPVSIKFTGTDGYSTIFTNDRLRAGIDEYRAIVSRAGAEAAAQAVGRTLDPSKGVAVHLSVWGRDQLELFGCATGTTSPASAATHYVDLTSSGGAHPVTTRMSTDPAWSTAWHFGVEPGAVDFTMTDGNATATATLPNVQADAVNIIVSTLEPTDYTYNPTAASCFTPAPVHDCSMFGTLRSINSGQVTAIMYENQSNEVRKVWWIDRVGNLRELGPFAPGSRHMHQAQVDNYFMITNENDECISIHEATVDDVIAVLN